MGGALGRLGLLALIAFHAYLFWARLLDGGFFEPAVAARWFSGALLTVAFAVLSRTGVSLLWGRKAVVLWLLVVLLHVHAAWSPRVTEALDAVPDEVAAFVLQATSVSNLLAVGFVLIALLLRASAARPHPAAWFPAQARVPFSTADGCRLLLSPRPPPLR